MVFNIKTMAMATAISAGAIFAMPVAGQAMPQSSPVKIHAVKDSNIVDVQSRKWRKRWARYCRYNDDPRCYRRSYSRHYRYRYYDRYDDPYYGYYRPRYRSPGIGLHFNID